MNKRILRLIAILWEMYPEQRFGQLLESFIFNEGNIFHKEDKEVEQILKWRIRQHFTDLMEK